MCVCGGGAYDRSRRGAARGGRESFQTVIQVWHLWKDREEYGAGKASDCSRAVGISLHYASPSAGIKMAQERDFSGGLVVKSLPANVGDTGLIPDPGTRNTPAVGQLSPCTTAAEPTCPRSSPRLLQLEKACSQQRRAHLLQQRPSTVKYIHIFFKKMAQKRAILWAETAWPCTLPCSVFHWPGLQGKRVALDQMLCCGGSIGDGSWVLPDLPCTVLEAKPVLFPLHSCPFYWCRYHFILLFIGPVGSVIVIAWWGRKIWGLSKLGR